MIYIMALAAFAAKGRSLCFCKLGKSADLWQVRVEIQQEFGLAQTGMANMWRM